MKLLRAFGRACVFVFIFLFLACLWIGSMFVVDVYVLGWFGVTAGEGIGIYIVGFITLLVAITYMEYDSKN